MTMRSPRLILLFAAAMMAVAAPLSAQETLQVTLVSEVKAVQPGVPFYVALRLQHKEGYHTYWKFPGIVGVPTSMDWELPPGWTAGELEWPQPKQVHMFKIRAQGYHDTTLLPVRITPPMDLAPGSTVTLKGKSSWMCCGRDCNPGFTPLTLTLPVNPPQGSVRPDTEWQPQIAAALATVPRPLKGWATTASRVGNFVTLKLTPHAPSKATAPMKKVLFFTDDGLINADKDQHLELRPDGSLVLKLEVSQYADQPLATQLKGVLQSPEGWDAGGTTKSVAISVDIVTKEG